MIDIDSKNTFRGLPLTSEQEAIIKHYIKVKKRHGEPWETPELNAMLKDMLEPPSNEEGLGSDVEEMKGAAERAAASIDKDLDPTEASEERNAVMESESMKGPKR